VTLIRTCAKAIIIEGDRILCVKYIDEGGDYYALPGGAQLHGETLSQTLLRECLEELGVAVVNLGLRFVREYIGSQGDSAWRDAAVHQVEFLFECGLPPDQQPGLGPSPDYSQVGVVWVSIAEIPRVRFYPKSLVPYLGRPFPDAVEYWGAVD
jgi:8-oxo-dGTP pyrophosphatase MutT (NUDIX family)